MPRGIFASFVKGLAFEESGAAPTPYATMPRPGLCRVLTGEPRLAGVWAVLWRHSLRVCLPLWKSDNQLFTFSSTIERLRQGPLSEHLDADAAAVGEQGYAEHSIRRRIVTIADFSRWLKRKHIAVEALDGNIVDHFLHLRRRQQQIHRGDAKALARMLVMLCQSGVVKQQELRSQVTWAIGILVPNASLMAVAGLFPLNLTAKTTAAAIVESVAAALAGAALYKEGASSARSKAARA